MTSDLALHGGAKRRWTHAGDRRRDVDLIVLATTTPDQTFPADRDQGAGRARHDARRRLRRAGGLLRLRLRAVGRRQLHRGSARRKTALVIGAETFSRILDWNDRGTCVLFGDGAGAVVLQAGRGQGTTADRGILSTHLHSDGRHHDLLYVDGGPSTTQTAGHRAHGRARKSSSHAVTKLAEVVDEALAANGLTAADIDWLVPHQANKRIIDGTARKLGSSDREGGHDGRPPRATPRPPRSRWRWPKRSRTAASSRAIWC